MEVYLLTLWNITILLLLFLTVDSMKIKECSLMFQQSKQSHKSLLKTARLLTITVELENSTNLPECVVKNSDLIQPLQWKRISGTHGKGLLQLQPFYEMLSLSLLSYRTEKTSITLQSKPPGCLENLNELEYELVFRNFFLNFTRENEEICNEHIGNRSKYAIFYHECCHYDHNGNMQCNPVLKNKWMLAIEYCTYIVIIIVVLYCPLLVPSSLYDSDYGPKRFVHFLHDSHFFFVKKQFAPKPELFIKEQMDGESSLLSYAKLKDMKKFKEKLKTMDDKHTHQFKFTKIYFNVRADELLSANEAPISLSKILYNLFLKCGIRKQEGVATCCKSNIFGKCLQSRINFQWYKLFRFILRIILSLAVCLPWIIRICIFYVYENEVRETRHQAAETRNLLLRIEHSIAYYGTPLHILFILSYAFICLGYISLELTSVGIYTMIGIILNSSHAMQYISTISLAWLYYHKCFGEICQIYESYNKAVQRILYRTNKQNVDNVAKKQISEQENMAFEVNGSETMCGQADKKDANELVEIYFGNEKEEKINGRQVSLDLTDNGEVSVKSVFKKKFDYRIREDEKWWTIADFDVTKDDSFVGEQKDIEKEYEKKRNVKEQLDRNDEYDVGSIHPETVV
ncbi:unnamed protein product [Mytilus coruscus]|uniref:Uncharacterized protein n=1 Tax=Mytilus coruscus TaxID=42192 RepID=A0A6J8DKM0_MYTCO|nr:unnamed protein product [Mytilus coruscus]